MFRFPVLPYRWRIRAILAVLALVVTFSPWDRTGERIGDNLQIALPLLAWGCEAMNGNGPEYLLRYVVMWTALHGTKQALGEAPINQRPNGGIHGFPSGHTSTAVFGASSLVQSCVVNQPIVKGVILTAAAFVGTSRIESNWHDIWQVFAGVGLGWVSDRAFRKNVKMRAKVRAFFAGLGGHIRKVFSGRAG